MSDKQQVEELVNILKTTYDGKYAKFRNILKGSILTFADQLYQNGIIGDNVFRKRLQPNDL